MATEDDKDQTEEPAEGSTESAGSQEATSLAPRRPSVSEETRRQIERFLDNQTEELRQRGEQLKVTDAQSERQHVFALRALDAQATDRRETRASRTERLKIRATVGSLIVIAVVVIIVYAIHSGNKDLAIELVKAIAFFVGGGGVGYGVGRHKAKQDHDEDDDTQDT